MSEAPAGPSGPAGPGPDAADADADARVREAAWAQLRANDTGRFVKPARHQYPHQWAWDAAFIAIGLRHVDTAMAARELRALLSARWSNGMVPHIVYHGGPSDYFPTPDFWRIDAARHAPAVATSGLTQPPVLATAVRMVADAASPSVAEGLVRDTFPQLLAYHRWLRAARDPDETGLVAIVHPWESGTDDAPRFTAALAAIGEPAPPPYRRRDQHHVRADERPTADTYARFMHLIGTFRDHAWDDEALYRRSPFLVQDVAFNAVLHRADADLLELARRLGEPVAEIERWRSRTRDAFDERSWDASRSCYLDVDLRSGERRDAGWAGLAPLYAGAVEPGRAARMAAAHLRDPARFGAGGAVRYVVPSVAVSDAEFEPRRYWRGPVWINVSWLLARGLRSCGEVELADTIRAHALELVGRHGFWEYYDPRDGTPCGAAGFSWSAALVLDMLHRPDGR